MTAMLATRTAERRAPRIVHLAAPDDFEGWREAARALALIGASPDEVLWEVAGERDLFAAPAPAPPAAPGLFSVPRAFVDLARHVVLHRDPERFSLLYNFLCRLRERPRAMEDGADPLLRRLERMAMAVRRDMHRSFPDGARADLLKLWHSAEPTAKTFGVLPMEVLQSAFWSLDPARTVAKFEAFATMTGEEARTFVMLEDWANDGPPVPEAAAREMFEGFFERDATGRGEWRVGDQIIDPAAFPCPLLNIVSTTDRIVPAASAPRAGRRLDLALGHVGMIVGSRAREALWEPLAGWLSRQSAS